MRAQSEEEAITQLLCIPGPDFTRAVAKRRVRVMRTNMTTLTPPAKVSVGLCRPDMGKYAYSSTDF